jgi:hypothetical protein
VGFGEPKFYLFEVEKVDSFPDGRASTSYSSSGQRIFGPAEWQKIVDQDGDFSAIGYKMEKNQPVAGFQSSPPDP